MPTTPPIEPTDSPTAGGIIEARSSPGRRDPARNAGSRLLGVRRGDKYMVNAYPPGWRGPSVATEVRPRRGRAIGQPVTSRLTPGAGASTPVPTAIDQSAANAGRASTQQPPTDDRSVQ